MDRDYQRVFEKVKSRVQELGFERKFLNLGSEPGPPIPQWIQNSTIYEIYVRAFSDEGTFKAVEKALPDLKNYGFTALWFMPIFPIGFKKRKGSLGSPYAIRDYFTVNPEYGTEQDFKNLVNRAHQLDMKVIIDMVPNHVAHDYTGLQQQPHLVKRTADGLPMRKIADWSDVIDLDYAQPQTREHMAEVMKFWIKNFDVDGYRCDVAGMVPLDFWEWIAPQLREIKEDFFLLAEWESPALHKMAFNSTYDWSTFELLLKVVQDARELPLLAEWLTTKTALYPKQALPLRFIENHDLPRAASRWKTAQLKMALLFIFSLHGIPLIYNGQEIGAEQSPSLFDKTPINWQVVNHEVNFFLQKLIALRSQEAGLSSNQYLVREAYLKEGILFLDKENLHVLINITDKPKLIDTPEGKEILNTHEQLIFKSSGLELQPYQGLVLKNPLYF